MALRATQKRCRHQGADAMESMACGASSKERPMAGVDRRPGTPSRSQLRLEAALRYPSARPPYLGRFSFPAGGIPARAAPPPALSAG